MGFVVTKNDPYFVIDVDKAYDGTNWSPLAHEICRAFPGAYVEISKSGTGLHLFGCTKIQPFPHKCKISKLGIELYTEKRFITLTEFSPQGNPNTPHDLSLWRVIEKYFKKPNVEKKYALLSKAFKHKGVSSVFGGKASCLDLFYGDKVTLGNSYPSVNGGPFDHSSADAALISHLAYWTRDKEFTEELFNMSVLSLREKWQSRQDYRQATIDFAFEGITKAGPEIKTGVQYSTVEHQQELFKGCTYVAEANKVLTADGVMLKQEAFKVLYGGYLFTLDAFGKKTTANAWTAFTESQVTSFPKVHRSCFLPKEQPLSVVSRENLSYVNTYFPISTIQKPGDASPFTDHVKAMLPNGDDHLILFSYMAAIVQNPGAKFQFAPLIQGVEGNGKSLILRVLEHAVGKRYTHFPNAHDLIGNGSKFNAWLKEKLFIGVEDISAAKGNRFELIETLKTLITNDRIEIQLKGVDQVTGDNYANFIFCCNPKDAFPKIRHDRRFCILYCAQQSEDDINRIGWGGSYFPNLYNNWLKIDGYAIVNQWLREFSIPDQYNPATMCHRAPGTTSTKEALTLGQSRIEALIQEAVDSDRVGFRGNWISSVALSELLKNENIRISHVKRPVILEGLGYIPHPSLLGGRLNNPLPGNVESGKPRLYVKKGALLEDRPMVIGEAYCKAQRYLL